jgi:MFS family permease
MGSSSAWKSWSSLAGNAGRLLLGTTSALAFLAFLNATVLNVALPDLARAFDADAALVRWTVTAYVTVLAAGLIAGGRLADSAGRRRILAVGAALFALASAGGMVAGSAATLIAARIFQGAAAALITPASFGLLLEATPADQRTRAVGVWSSAAATSAFVGPSFGGLLVDFAGWRAPLVLSAVAALVLLGFVVKLPRSREPDGEVPSLRGAVLGGAAIAVLAVTTTKAQGWGWTDPRTIVGLATGASGVAAGVLGLGGVNWRVVDRGLLRRKAFAAANALSIVFGFAAFSWLLAGPLFVATLWHWDALAAALSVAPGAVAAALAAWAAGRLPSRAHAWVIVLGGAVLGTTMLVLIAAVDESPRFLTLWLPAGILAGIATGGALTSLSATVAASVPTRDFAQGAGINMTARQLGGALGVAAVTAVVSARGGPDQSSFAVVWLVIGIASAVTAAGAVTLVRRGERRDRSADRAGHRVNKYSSVTL